MNIIPKPFKTKALLSSFELSRDTNAYVSAQFRSFADDALFLIRKIFTSFSGKTIISDTNFVVKGGINFIYNSTLPHEGYKLRIDDNSITISASDDAGFQYAVSSLRQILVFPPTKQTYLIIDGCDITDMPRFEFRGFTFDESRHFFGKNEVKRILDLMCLNKLNKFIWHLSDDQGYRIASTAYPELIKIASVRHDTQIGGPTSKKYRGLEHSGYYTPADINEIIQYAKERNIDIIPELSLPHHTQAIRAAIPLLGATNEHLPVSTNFVSILSGVCTTDETAFGIVCDIIDEICRLFQSEYIHLGGHFEENGVDYELCPSCNEYYKNQNLNSMSELYSLFFNKIADHVKRAHNKHIIIRDPSYSELLDTSVIVELTSTSKVHKIIDDINSGRKLIIAPSNLTNFAYPYAITPLAETYNNCLLPNDFALLEKAGELIIGATCALWTHWVYDKEKLDFNCFPRLAAVADKYWSLAPQTYRDFANRFYGNTKIYDDERVNYAKAKLVMPSQYRRFRDRWLWLHSDQYSEVRRNR